jgi:hypothetical protein
MHSVSITHTLNCDECLVNSFTATTKLFETFRRKAIKAGWKIEGPLHLDPIFRKHICPHCEARRLTSWSVAVSSGGC